MIFLLDNDVPEAIARIIEQAGHKSLRLRDALPIITPDKEILQFAFAQQALLVTCNRDHFLALGKTSPHSGIVILIHRQSRIAECSHFLHLLESAGENGLRGNINFA
ncbi:MAG: DUF5615 family PIN-like protein [Verrucomicrobiales bacterium]|nr:DUF5615 family PIN-like protein [Verrucomicrobiales bacterium]